MRNFLLMSDVTPINSYVSPFISYYYFITSVMIIYDMFYTIDCIYSYWNKNEDNMWINETYYFFTKK